MDEQVNLPEDVLKLKRQVTELTSFIVNEIYGQQGHQGLGVIANKYPTLDLVELRAKPGPS